MKTKLLAATAVVALLGLASVPAMALTGTWTLDPPQAQNKFQVSVDPPINADGTSVWSAKSVVPVQYDLLVGFGPVVFESLLSGSPVFSNLDFKPSAGLTFPQLTNLQAEYTFTSGTCHAGALRWSIIFGDGSTIFIYYGKDATFWNDCSSNTADPVIDQSTLNMINAGFDGGGPGTDVRYETSDHPGSYTTYTNAVAFAGSKTISDVVLVLDAGFAGDQVLTLGHVTVNDNTFVPQTGTSAVCPSQPATIQVSKIGTGGNLTIDETLQSIQNDTGKDFRIVGCKYMYNIAGKSLGAGQYKVDALINGGGPSFQAGVGTVFALKP